MVGAGPGGKHAARGLAKAGQKVAAMEAELVGGECPFWACIPSKTLLRPIEARGEAGHVAGLDRPALHWDEVARYRDYMVADHDDTAKAEKLAEAGVEIVRGRARLDGPGRVVAGERTLRADRIVLATGTTSAIPPVAGLDGRRVLDQPRGDGARGRARERDRARRRPGGDRARADARALRRPHTLVEAAPRLLARETAPVGDLLAELLADDGHRRPPRRQGVAGEASGAGVRVHVTAGDAVRPSGW